MPHTRTKLRRPELFLIRESAPSRPEMEQRAKQVICWLEPFVHLRAPKIFNLRRDPFERADESSNTYWDWMIPHVYVIYAMQALVAGQIAEFEKYPPRQKPASFNLDAVMRKLEEANSGGNH